MSTSNFYYKNRCIVVSDEDFDNDNVPEYDNRTDYGLRSYPSFPLREQPNCKILIAVLTGAYYSGACIDYIEDDTRKDEMTEKQYDRLLEIEEKRMNKFLDKLRDGYGFDEARCVARFSNGEAVYEKI